MRRTILLLLSLLLCLASPAARAEEEALFAWTLMLGEGGLTEPRDMAPSAQGGVMIVGSTDSADTALGEPLGGADGFLARVGADGAVRWQLRLGGSGDDMLSCVLEMPGGDWLALGTTASADGSARASRGGTDAWLVRVSAGGDLLWSKTLGGSADDELTVLQLTEAGMIFACGRTQSRNGDLGANFGGWDAWATLLSPEDGKPTWTYRYGHEGDDRFVAAMPIQSGWLLLGEGAEASGTTAEGETAYAQRPIVQMVSVEGVAAWETPITLGSTGESRLTAMIETESGWLLGGETNSRSALMPTPYGGQDLWVLHLRQGASVAWQRTYGGTRDEALHSLHAVPSGGYALLATTESTDGQIVGAHGGSDLWLVRTTASGALEWQQPIGGSEASAPAALLIHEDGRFLVAGTTLSQDGDIGRHLGVRTGFLSLLSPNGNLRWTRTITQGEECSLLMTCVDGGVAYLLGNVREVDAAGRTEAIWVARLALEGFLDE